MAKPPESSSNPERYEQLEFDLAQAAQVAELVLGTTRPQDDNYPETLKRQYLEGLEENRQDVRRTNAPWRDGGDGKQTLSPSPNVGGKLPVSSHSRRHISRTGPRRPRDSKGQSKYVTYPPIPEYTPPTDEEVEAAREARKAYEARKAEKANQERQAKRESLRRMLSESNPE